MLSGSFLRSVCLTSRATPICDPSTNAVNLREQGLKGKVLEILCCACGHCVTVVLHGQVLPGKEPHGIGQWVTRL